MSHYSRLETSWSQSKVTKYLSCEAFANDQNSSLRIRSDHPKNLIDCFLSQDNCFPNFTNNYNFSINPDKR